MPPRRRTAGPEAARTRAERGAERGAERDAGKAGGASASRRFSPRPAPVSSQSLASRRSIATRPAVPFRS